MKSKTATPDPDDWNEDDADLDTESGQAADSPYRRASMVGSRVFEAAAAKYTDNQAEIFRWVFHLQRENGWSQNHLAKVTKISSAAFSKLFRGTYEADVEQMAERLRKWRVQWLANEGVENPNFIMTSVASDVFFACEKATLSKVVVLVHGVYGLGKTEALEEYRRLNNHGKTLYIRCPSSGGLTTFQREIARQIGENSKQNADALRHAIIDNLRKRAHLVIFDELHEVFLTGRTDMPVRWCEFIRELFDKCDVGVVLCGTQVLPDLLREGKFAKALEQLTDRGSGVEVALDPNIPDEDLAKFYDHYGLGQPTGRAAEIVTDVLKAHSLRRLCFLLEDGQRLAINQKTPFTWEHFVLVHNTLVQRAKKKPKK